jgi:hypothetical protein
MKRYLIPGEGIQIIEDVVNEEIEVVVRRDQIAHLDELASLVRADRGAGLLGFNGGLNYPPNSLGGALKSLIIGGPGGPGASAGFADFIFRRASTEPAIPTGDGTPAGWSDDPPPPNGMPLWFSTGDKTASNFLVGAWSRPVRLDGTNGTDGTDGEGIEVQFSADGIAGWHSTFVAGDLFMRQRKGTGAWSIGWRVVGETGQTGATGAAGQNSATVTLYQRSESAPPLPSAAVVYTFATGVASGINNGWQQGVPAGTAPLWATLASAVNSAATDTLAPGEWTTAQKLVENGAPGGTGSPGLNSATVFLYQRTSSDTPPALPSAPVVYTFATGVATGVNNGWQQGLQASGGAYRWLTTGTAAASGASDTIIATEWAAARLLAQDGAPGLPGDPGEPGEPGAPALSARLSAYAAVFAADSTGLVDSGQSFPVAVSVLLGLIDDTSNWTVSRTSSHASITTTLAGSTVTITGMGTALDTGWVDIQATRSGYPTQGPLRVNLAKAKRATAASGPVANIGSLSCSHFALSPIDTFASVEFMSNGQIRTLSGSTSTVIGNWYLPTTPGIGSNYQVALNRISGDVVDINMGVLSVPRYATLIDTTDGFSFRQSTVGFSIKTTGGVAVSDGLIYLDTAIES